MRQRISGRGRWQPDVEERRDWHRLRLFRLIATLEIADALDRLEFNGGKENAPLFGGISLTRRRARRSVKTNRPAGSTASRS